MSFGGYETTFLLSGLAMGVVGLVAPGKSAGVGARASTVAIGAAMIGYSFYVAAQTSGMYLFPLQLVVLPWAFLAKWAYDGYRGSQPMVQGIAERANRQGGSASPQGHSLHVSSSGDRRCASGRCDAFGLPTHFPVCDVCRQPTSAVPPAPPQLPPFRTVQVHEVSESAKRRCANGRCDAFRLLTRFLVCDVCRQPTGV